MQAAALPSKSERGLEETRRALGDLVQGRFGAIPEGPLLDQVLRLTARADFAVREAAVEALHRRWSSAEREGLVVATRPAGSVLGSYSTGRAKPGAPDGRRRAHEARPYATELTSVEPIAASCDCPDFVRSSLGLCKHALVVLADVFGSSRRLAQARADQAKTSPASRPPRLEWNPELPLDGGLDRLEGLRLTGVAPTSRGGAAGRLARLRRAFGHGVIESVRLDPERRRDILRSVASLDASPAARRIVREELERVERRLACASAVEPALEALRTLRRRLYPYQKEGVERFLASGRVLLADDMGLGKTTQAIAACHCLFAAGEIRKGLVIVPASLKAQWLREWRETTSTPVAIVEGTPPERAEQYRRLRSGFLIVNYEQLLRDAERVHAIRPDIVVLDEAQRIKNYATKSAIYVKSLGPKYRLVLTGTPMENRLEELASILDWVDDVALSPKWRLVPWYTRWDGDGAAGKTGARNLDGLRARLASCVVRRVRRDVLAQLPPRTDTRVPVEMTPQQLAEHEELVLPIARLVQTARRRPLAQPEFLRLMQLLTQQRMIANGLGQVRFEELWPTYSRARPDPTLLEGLFSPKLTELRRLIADLVVEQGRKVVVFSQWRRMLRLAEWSVRDVLGDRGIRSLFFTGAEKQSQRTKNVVEFHDDPRASVMFLSDAGGVGLNLQKAASACINLELPWNPAVLEQRIGRIYRLGQKRPIDVYNLVAEASIEGRIAGLLGAKQALFSGLFDGTSDEVSFDTAASFLTRVERVVDPGPLPAAPTTTDERDATEERDADDGEAELPAAFSAAGASDAALADEVPPDSPLRPATAPPNPVAALFDAVRVERTPEGGLRIEAPPEVAGSLAALFQGMVKLLGTATGP